MSNTGIVAGKYILINTAIKTLQVFQGHRKIKSFAVHLGKGMPSDGQYKVISKTYNTTANNELKLSRSDGSLSLCIYGKKLSTTGRVLRGRGLLWLTNDDLEELFTLVSIGTPVFITAEKPMPELDQSPNEEQPINEPLVIEPLPELPLEETTEICHSPETEQTEQPTIPEQLLELEQPVEQEIPQQQNTATEPTALPPAGFYYTVIPGDSLWRIARKFNLPMQLIMMKNSLDNPNRIYPGQKIFIPYRS